MVLPDKLTILRETKPKYGRNYTYNEVPQFVADFWGYALCDNQWFWRLIDSEWHRNMKSNVRDLLERIMNKIPVIDRGYTSDNAPNEHLEELMARANKVLPQGQVPVQEAVDKWAAMCVLEAYARRTRWVRFGNETGNYGPSRTFTRLENVNHVVIKNNTAFTYNQQEYVTRANPNYESELNAWAAQEAIKSRGIPKAESPLHGLISFIMPDGGLHSPKKGLWVIHHRLDREGNKPTKRKTEVYDKCRYETDQGRHVEYPGRQYRSNNQRDNHVFDCGDDWYTPPGMNDLDNLW